MKILLLSDTHGYLDEAILDHAKAADEIWHAGDIGTDEVAETLSKIKPFRAVYGNIDGQSLRLQYPIDNRFTVDGLEVWMTHIGGYPGHFEKRVREILMVQPPQLFICGHSHILRVMRDPKYNVLCMNPGAAGVHGFHKIRTMIRFSVSQGKVINPEVIELGKRGALLTN